MVGYDKNGKLVSADSLNRAVTRQIESMKAFDIKPKIGVGPILIGMNREEVRQHLGPPRWR